jgi:hypothetical protein
MSEHHYDTIIGDEGEDEDEVRVRFGTHCSTVAFASMAGDAQVK